MHDEKITVKMENGQALEVVVTGKQADAIWIALGEGIHNVKCKLTPTRNGLAYAGSVMGRELIYARSVKEIKAEIAREEQQRFQHRIR